MSILTLATLPAPAAAPDQAAERLSQTYEIATQQTGRDAGHYARLALTGRNVPHPVVDRAAVVMRILVENAAKHVGGRIVTSLRLTRDGIDVEVYDGARVRQFGPDGAGLTLVRQIADLFEWIPGPAGKTAHAVIGYEATA